MQQQVQEYNLTDCLLQNQSHGDRSFGLEEIFESMASSHIAMWQIE